MEQISEKLNRIKIAKENIKKSIENKGVIVGDVSIETYAEKIDEITTGGATIKDAGYLFYNGYRTDQIEEVCSLISSDCEQFTYMFSGCGNLTEIPKFNTSGGLNFSYMFNNCTKLISVPQLDTSKGTNLNSMFYHCDVLETIPDLDTSKATTFNHMFGYCYALREIPQLETGNSTTFGSTFSYCNNLTTIPLLDLGKAVTLTGIVANCTSLTSLGGFKDLGKAYETYRAANYSSYKLDLSQCTSLTHDSLMNVINNLYDIATKGCKAQSLTLGSTNLDKLTEEEIAIATNKGWSVS